VSGLQVQEHGFGVFAGAEFVDLKVNGRGVKLPLGQIADFHKIGHPASRANFEVRKDGMPRIQVPNPGAFFRGPKPAPIDLVLVGRSPVPRCGKAHLVASGAKFPSAFLLRHFPLIERHDLLLKRQYG